MNSNSSESLEYKSENDISVTCKRVCCERIGAVVGVGGAMVHVTKEIDGGEEELQERRRESVGEEKEAIRSFLLPDYNIRLEKCRCHFSALHAEMPPQATRQKNAHVYVDDIVVKTKKRGTLLEDLRETFANLR